MVLLIFTFCNYMIFIKYDTMRKINQEVTKN